MTHHTDSQYDVRVRLAQAVLRQGTELDDASARTLAIRVLRAVDTIPEQVR